MSINVVNQGPWRVSSLLWQPLPGTHAFTVTCCSSFKLSPGESPLVQGRAEPLPPEGDPRTLVEPWGPVVPRKRKAEVVVVGHAHAPGARPVRELSARLTLGALHKVVQIRGDSWFAADGAISEPLPFTTMPLRWERAAGGPGTANPVGMPMGARAVADRWGRVAIPNFLRADAVLAARADAPDPIGFGPIPPEWPTRADRLGSHGRSLAPASWAERPLPPEMDLAYFNVAPRDQMLNELPHGDRLVLDHLHPHHPHLVTRLQALVPQATTRISGVERSIAFRCDTLVIEADHGRALLVWRAQLPIEDPRRDGVVLLAPSKEAAVSSGTLPASLVPPAATLPFQRSRQSTVQLVADQPFPEALPFQPSPPGEGAEPVVPASQPAQPDHRALPFRPSVPPPPPPDDEPEEGVPTQRRLALMQEPAPASERTEPAYVAPVRALPSIPPPSAPHPAWLAKPADEPPPAAASQAAPPTPRSPEPIAPPPPPPPPASPHLEAPPALPLDEYPLPRAAAIAARLQRRPDDHREILERELLEGETWEAVDAHWRGVVDTELGRGRKKLLVAYDEAYVEALEAERGPISALDYARLLLAIERGAAGPVLGELGLPEEAIMRLRRVWLGRSVRDPRAAEALRLAMRTAAESA